VDLDPNDPDADVVGGMDEDVAEDDRSITKFLTLPTISARVSDKKRDSIVDLSKSIMLTADAYIQAAKQLKMRVEEASKEAVQSQQQRQLQMPTRHWPLDYNALTQCQVLSHNIPCLALRRHNSRSCTAMG
jgi:hypothetical protein